MKISENVHRCHSVPLSKLIATKQCLLASPADSTGGQLPPTQSYSPTVSDNLPHDDGDEQPQSLLNFPDDLGKSYCCQLGGWFQGTPFVLIYGAIVPGIIKSCSERLIIG